jgi:hypothetical protein
MGLAANLEPSVERFVSLASHNRLAKNAGVAGGAVVGNDNRMMSTGNVVGAAHYSTFADALNRLTSKSWRVIS